MIIFWLILLIFQSVTGLKPEETTEDVETEENYDDVINQALDIGLSIFLALHVIILIGMVIVQKPWKICCYPRTSFKSSSDADSRIYS